ncbi:hypothetical protein E4U54_005349 [Claviceps lovelessii]|nr:hypothetical protein E4U54_005349 [Claviceps lovelessii]
MEDVYPIGINSTFNKWGTPCNTTYGDCGCDNCAGNVQDVSARLDALAQYEDWRGLWPKTKAHNPQTFHGEGYWSRNPSDEELVAMNALSFHHGAKLIAAWVWPFTDALGKPMGSFGATVSTKPVRDFIVKGQPRRLDLVAANGQAAPPLVDVACWVGEHGDRLLVSVVNGGYNALDAPIFIALPDGMVVKKPETVVWGGGSWSWTRDKQFGNHGLLTLRGQTGMATNMIIVDV